MQNTVNKETEVDPDVGALAELIVLGKLLPTVGEAVKGVEVMEGKSTGGAGVKVTGAAVVATEFTGAGVFVTKVIGAGVKGAEVTGAGVFVTEFKGAGVTGAEFTGAGVTGAGVYVTEFTGAGVTGAEVTGADKVTGAGVIGGYPSGSMVLETTGTDVSLIIGDTGVAVLGEVAEVGTRTGADNGGSVLITSATGAWEANFVGADTGGETGSPRKGL